MPQVSQSLKAYGVGEEFPKTARHNTLAKSSIKRLSSILKQSVLRSGSLLTVSTWQDG
jgi:hypothetical protein